MDMLLHDIRFGFRSLLRRPGFTLVAVLALALGIGANTAIFSMVNTVLLRQLPFRHSDRLVSIWIADTVQGRGPLSIPDFTDYSKESQSFEQMAALTEWVANLTNHDEPERLQVARVSANLFEVLGVNASFGRTLVPDDDKPDSSKVVVLTRGLWKRRFGSDMGLIGSKLTLNGEGYTVVGVLPDEFVFPGSKAELGVPLNMDSDPRRSERGTNFLRAIGRLKQGVSAEQAKGEMDSIARDLQQKYPQDNSRKAGIKITSLHEELVGDFRQGLQVLFGAVILVLLIACINIANMLLARSTVRQKEMAVRIALGASRWQLIRQLLTESLLLSIMGGLLGLALAYWGISFLVLLSPTALPRSKEINIDGWVLAFTLISSILAGIIFGLAPALQAVKTDVNEDLKGTGKGTTDGSHRNAVRSLLVISELALSVMLMIGAGLLIKSFLRLQDVNPGYNPANLLTARLSLPKARYPNRAAVNLFQDRLAPQLENLPGVQSVAAINILPLSGMRTSVDFTVEGQPVPSMGELPGCQYRLISPDYFRTMNIPVLNGREFTDQDTDRTAPVVIINDVLARRFLPNGDAVGKHLNIGDGDQPLRGAEIIGVVESVREFGLEAEQTPTIYVPYLQMPEARINWATSSLTWVIRTSKNPLALSEVLRREIRNMDKDIPASGIKTMEEFISTSVAPRRFNLLLLEVFAVAALLLAISGIYAVISYSVAQRRKEIGIRMALGAQPGQVIKLILGQGVKIISIGVVVGLGGAFALSRVLSSLLFGISATDPVPFVVASVLLTLAALMASYIPARGAAKVNPMIALRAE
ncbi:MAG: ABC transporter permease [Blastocatellia bacterium]